MKHLLDINDLSKKEIEQIFKLTDKLRNKKTNLLKQKTIGLLFAKPSTRTRVSFEVGMVQLGGHALDLSGAKMQVFSGREAISDTSKTLSRYLNAVIARLYSHEDLLELAKHSSIPIINGLTDFNHPCQALTDLYTVKKEFGKLKGIHLVFVGDGSDNVCSSLIQACYKLGVKITVATPRYYPPDAEILKRTHHHATVTDNAKQAVKNADVIYTDTWISMGQEKQKVERKRRLVGYQVNAKLLSYAHPQVRIMHCLPAHRGEEITDRVLDGKHSIVFDQAENRLHVQKAILYLLLK